MKIPRCALAFFLAHVCVVSAFSQSGPPPAPPRITSEPAGGAAFTEASKTVAPTLTITAPTANEQSTNPVFIISGKTTGKIAVTNVSWQLNQSSWSNAIPMNGWSNWTATATLAIGSNVLRAFAQDAGGNQSPVKTVNFFYLVKAPLTVEITGKGTVSPNYNGQMLPIGKIYSMKALPAAGCVFANWTGNLPTNKPKITFTMASNLTLIANFLDVMPPTVSISSPTANQQIKSLTFTVKGKAADNVGVAHVYCQINGGAWTLAQTSNHFTNWTAAVQLVESANIIRAYAVDTNGNFSRTNSVKVVYAAPIKITSLSATNAGPFALLQIKTTGLLSTNPVVVEFFDYDGFAVGVTPLEASNGTIIVGVPPYMNPNTNTVQGASVNLQLFQTNGSSNIVSDFLPFTIEEPPALSSPPGEFTRIFLQGCLDKMTELISNVSGTTLDTTAMAQSLSERTNDLTVLLSKIQGVMQTPSVPFSLGKAGQTEMILDQTNLANVDRLLLAFLQAQASGVSAPSRLAETLSQNPECAGQAASEVEKQYESIGISSSDLAVHNYYSVAVNCLPSAVNSSLNVVGSSAGVGSAVFAFLAEAAGVTLGAAAALPAAGVLTVTVVAVGGVIAVEGAVGQKTPALAQDIQKDLKTLNSTIVAPAVDAVLSWKTSEATTALYDLVSSGKDLYDAFSEAVLIVTYSLTVGTAGPGHGSVTVSPSGFVYNSGTVVKVTAVPKSDSEFVSWSGDASGTAKTASITMDADKSATATFKLKTVTGSDYAGTWTGQFNVQYTQYDSDWSHPQQLSKSFDATMVLKPFGPVVNGYQMLTVTKFSASDPMFACDSCVPKTYTSWVTLPSPPGTTSEESDITILFPNGNTLLISDGDDLCISSDGSVINNCGNEVESWDATYNKGNYFHYYGIEYYQVNSMTWSFTHTSK